MNIDLSRYSVGNVIDIQIHICIDMYVLYEGIYSILYCDGGDDGGGGGVDVFNSIQLFLILLYPIMSPEMSIK